MPKYECRGCGKGFKDYEAWKHHRELKLEECTLINITLYIPEVFEEFVQNLVLEGIIRYKTDFIRLVLDDFLEDNITFLKSVLLFNDSNVDENYRGKTISQQLLSKLEGII